MRLKGVWAAGAICVFAAWLGPTSAFCAQPDNDDVKHIAQLGYLATLVPDLCPQYEADSKAVAGIFLMKNISPKDLDDGGKYSAAIAAVDLQFRSLADKDPRKACDLGWNMLGGRLLKRKP